MAPQTPRVLRDQDTVSAASFRLCLLLPTLACSRTDAHVEVIPPSQPLAIVAAEPVRVLFPARPGEPARQTHVFLDLLWRMSAWSVLTPDDFTVLDPDSSDFLHSTNLVLVAHDLGIEPKRFGVLRASLSAREAKGQAVVAGGGKVSIGRDYEGYVDALLELLGADGQRVASATASVRIDPFAEMPENDEAPWIRGALEKATQALLEACRGCVTDVPRPGFVLYSNPAAVLRRSVVLARPAEHELNVDRLEREQKLWRFFQFFDPKCSLDDAKRLEALGDSVCAGSDVQLPLEPGDCIVSLGGTRFASPHQLMRALKGRTRVTLEVVDAQGTRRTVNGLDLLP